MCPEYAWLAALQFCLIALLMQHLVHWDSTTLQVEGDIVPDLQYYLAQQIHPVVSRLCAPIEGTSAGQLADCLGLDPSRFHAQTSRDRYPPLHAAAAHSLCVLTAISFGSSHLPAVGATRTRLWLAPRSDC